jgi:hypothetical protein
MNILGRRGMGASGWDYVTAHKGDLASSLAALHAEVFESDNSYFRGVLDRWGLPQPATLDDLWSETYGEFMGTNGTHSILDILTMKDINPLSKDELIETFNTDRPTRPDWDREAGQSAFRRGTSARRALDGTMRAPVQGRQAGRSSSTVVDMDEVDRDDVLGPGA